MLLLYIPILASLVASAPQQAPTSQQAPPPQQVDGLTGAPIDIQSMTATVVFDVVKRQAEVSADMVFEMIGEGGMPLFDLRQEIQTATLDGVEIAAKQLAAHDFGWNSGTMRILEQKLAPGESHTLHLAYRLAKPQSPHSEDIAWGEGSLNWDLFFSDLNPGRYLEMWFPANLLYDKLAIHLDLSIEGTQTAHELVTNAAVQVLGPLHWKLDFPAHFTAFSPMVVLVPSADVERASSQVKLPSGKKVQIDVCRRLEAGSTMKNTLKQVASHLQEFSQSMGEWAHGNKVTVFVWTGGRSMEYDGATTTSMGALRHELFHSWFGRGVKPRSQNDGWIDEAWDVYYADHGRVPSSELRREASPVELSSGQVMNRTTPGLSYSAGAMLFGRIALLVGEKELEQAMAGFFQKYQLQVISTADLENHLVKASDNEKIRQLFRRYVYGRRD